jgi:FKBP-type peptidyl-prolyl cis-trans isomerase
MTMPLLRSSRARVLAMLTLALALGACTLKEEGADGQPIPAPPDVAAPPKDATVTPSGVASKPLRPGLSSIHPSPRSNVKILYTGWTTDGQMFDTTAGKAALGPFPLEGSLIPGLVEGLQLMVVGEKRRFWIPAKLAYANDPDPKRPKGMLVFDVELVEVR